MAGVVCLQGGAEFGPACRAMDTDLLARAGGGPVVVAALAGAPGVEYRTACASGVRHFTDLGAPEAVAAPDAREDPRGAAEAIAGAALLVLPGGSPSRLRAALLATPVGALVTDLHLRGTPVLGASAGAMLLCATTVLPDAGARLAAGLGLVPDALVLPHFTGALDRWGALAAPGGTAVLGLPECCGLLVEGTSFTAVGAAASTVVCDGVRRELAVGETWIRSRGR